MDPTIYLLFDILQTMPALPSELCTPVLWTSDSLRYVQRDLLWGRLRHIGGGPCMLAAIQSLYPSDRLAMKTDGTAGRPAAHGGAAGLPAQSHLVWHFL